jgi:aldose 1-epimerase
MHVNDKPILMPPPGTLADWKAKPSQAGIPLLAPWANRIDSDSYWANGKKYNLNPNAVDLRRDANGLPIHGLLLFANAWHVTRLHAEADYAEVVSRLEFRKHPEWMAQFPFAHTIEMTHLLANGVLEVRTFIENHSSEPMPLAIGFHPWYQIPDCPRNEWRLHLPVRDHYTLSSKLIPTGETKPVDFPDPLPLAGRSVDDVFGGVNSTDEFWVEGRGQRVSDRHRLCPGVTKRSVLRTDDGHHQRLQPGPRRHLQKSSISGARPNLDRKFLDPPDNGQHLTAQLMPAAIRSDVTGASRMPFRKWP